MTDVGVHETVVDVDALVDGFTITVVATLLLPLCVESPGKLPVMTAVTVVDGVNVDWHVAVPAVAPAARVQVVKVPVPPERPRLTVPVGVTTGPAVDESATVAVQVEPWPSVTGLVHVTVVVVDLLFTMTLAAALVLPL
jgi:hypothetical protein